MKQHTTLEHWPTVLALLFALYLIATPLTACTPQPWKQDSDVQAAQRDCTGLAEGERYACIERHAVDSLNPDVCRLTGMWVDDMCLQAVYQAAGDPTICDKLYLKGVCPTCHTYYASLEATATSLSTPLALTETYTDTMLGLAFDYPAGWQVDAVADGFVRLYAPTPHTSTLGVVRYPQPSSATMDAVLDGVLQGGEGPRVTSTQPLTVGGQPAIQVLFGPPEDWRPDTVILVADPTGDWWTIDGRGELAIFDQIVGTLRWLPRDLPAPTAALSPTPATTPRSTPVPTSNLGKLAYVQGGDIWVKALPDREPQRLTTDGRNSQPRWSPSGEWLAFRKDEQVWLTQADGNDPHPLREGGPISTFAWAPAEDRLAYVTGSDVLGLETINADGTDPATLILPITDAVGRLGRIAWSPNRSWIAYEWLEQRPYQYLTYQGLWKVPADGGQRAELYASSAPEKGEAFLAGWSSDSQYVFFWQGDILSASLLADGVPLYSLPTGGGEALKLVDAVLLHGDFLASAPQGDRLAVTAGGYRATWTNKRVAVVEASGGELTWLTDESAAASSPAWSPDSVHLAYVAMPDQGDPGGGEDARMGMMERHIWVVNAQGEPQFQELTSDPAYRDERPLWSVDGSHILFVRMDDQGRASLWLVPFAGGTPHLVVDNLGPLPGPASGWFGYYGHVDWDNLFDWWRGPAVREVSLSPPDRLCTEILDALTAYQPVMDAQPTVTTLLSNIARWLNTGDTPSDLAAVLNEASDRTEGAMTVTELDLTGDGRDEVVIHIPVRSCCACWLTRASCTTRPSAKRLLGGNHHCHRPCHQSLRERGSIKSPLSRMTTPISLPRAQPKA